MPIKLRTKLGMPVVKVMRWPVCGWRHPWRRLRSVLAARAVARRAHCPVLVGTWVLPAEQGDTRSPSWNDSVPEHDQSRAAS